MLVSQFQAPAHFILAYLEDYKMDPHAATPLLTFSIFTDYADTKDLSLVRCDILNKNIKKFEGQKVVESLLDSYSKEEHYGVVVNFNERPGNFDVDGHINRMNDRWKSDT
jgi:ATP synthase mitochondrial F1 complex assembly factor 1